MDINFWMVILLFIFCLSTFVIFYSYVVFPFFLFIKSHHKVLPYKYFGTHEQLPKISIIVPAFNEEALIAQKIHSIFKTDYPKDCFEVLVGSDASTDTTNEIVQSLGSLYPQLQLFPFEQRRGKGNVINELYNNANGSIIIFTDANVLLQEDTLYELIKYFKDPQVGLSDTHMMNTNLKKSGISMQEKAYISREVKIKQGESRLWGTMMGPFGGCFAVRKELYSPVPHNFLVDDFYISMRVFEQGYHCINNTHAKVYEDISNNLKDEFFRKVRIATGNFQNLRRFQSLLFHPMPGLSYSLWSHKVLRWLGPFFILLAFVANVLLIQFNQVFLYLFFIYCLLLLLPVVDFALKKLNIHILGLRFITHFFSMNLALFIGFFKSLKKIKTNVWKPTQRNQA